MKDTQLEFFLDWIYAGYKNAYVSSINLLSSRNKHFERTEIVLPNVGRLCLYQTFVENYKDEQIPKFDVFYTTQMNQNIRTKIKSESLVGKSVCIIYECKKFFENNPEHKMIAPEQQILNKIKSDNKFARKMYEYSKKFRHKFLCPVSHEK